MKKIIYISAIVFLSLSGLKVFAQETKPEEPVKEQTQEPKASGTELQTIPSKDETKPAAKPEVKRIAPNQREGTNRRPQARPPREGRPEIIRPGGETRPAGAGRPRGFRRPGRG